MRLNSIRHLKTEEWYAVALSFVYFFSVLAAYYVVRPMRDQLAAEVGSTHLPLFFATTLLATLVLTPLFSWLVSRWPRRIVMPIVYIFFILCLIGFIPFFKDSKLLTPQTLGLIFFVWVSVFNLFVVSVFWSFMADIWDDEQARRLFPIIALGGTLGAIVGPTITHSLVETIGSAQLLTISASLLMIAVLCIVLLGRWAHTYGVHRKESGSEAAVGGSMWDGLRQIFLDPFIRNMALIMLLSDAIGTIAYALVTDYSGNTFRGQPIAQTQFAAAMDLASNIIQIILQLSITRWILIRYGAKGVFVITALVVVTVSLLMSISENPYAPIIGSMPAVALVLIVIRSLAHGMLQPARETLYTLVARDLRYKGKNAVDTVVWRIGDVISLLSIRLLRTLGVTAAGFGLIWASLAALSGFIGWRLANRVEKD